ncbi:hypothetical protein DQ244_17200 [Blastococcus sp. TBT05-19]|uniref:hypothetical protein n=1 Tax=Blastococcus sp. TBT05-19 TaxID=2250581 RepID=UPI000DEBE3F1|nr:hypothetical protein [Blastococcus sp. TBT05-19]RBY87076.1 hypothetical protein DQ244_17200 [Blastococcus sp. TBT05-19]
MPTEHTTDVLEYTTGRATITYLRPATRDHAYLVDARCERCHRDVLHGAGDDLDNLALGDRRTHCACPGSYELTDSDGVIPRRVAEIRADLTAREARHRAAH